MLKNALLIAGQRLSMKPVSELTLRWQAVDGRAHPAPPASALRSA